MQINITHENYVIKLANNSASISVKEKNKKGKVILKNLGYVRDLPSCIQKIIEHKISMKHSAIALEDYLKQYQQMASEILNLMSLK